MSDLDIINEAIGLLDDTAQMMKVDTGGAPNPLHIVSAHLKMLVNAINNAMPFIGYDDPRAELAKQNLRIALAATGIQGK